MANSEVVVAGGSAGMGRATVRAFAREGVSVALLARGEDGLEGAREEVGSLGVRALVVQTCVPDTGAAESVERVEQELGPIDVLTGRDLQFWAKNLEGLALAGLAGAAFAEANLRGRK